MSADPLETHYGLLTDALQRGSLVPFLGAGANLCGRPPEATHGKGGYLPSGAELASYLARHYPPGEPRDLLRVAQFVLVKLGSGPLYAQLRDLFDADYPITDLHRFLAAVPGLLRARGCRNPNLLVMTTNYDDLLEQAFAAAGESCDVVWYVADGDHRGKFRHRPPGGETQLISKPNEYGALSLNERSVVLKIHGAVSRDNANDDSYVITEDHYIDYLTRADIANLIPVTLAAKIRMSHFLFMGYSLADWNMRVILHRIWGGQQLSYKSWAIQRDPDELDIEFWRKRDVDILDRDIAQYVNELRVRLEALPVAATTKAVG